jgi:hypothetical protein
METSAKPGSPRSWPYTSNDEIGRRGLALANLLLLVHFLLLIGVLAFSVLFEPAINPHG